MNSYSQTSDVKAGTLGGTFFSILYSLGADMLHTAVMAFTGAVVSYSVSIIMKWLIEKRKKGVGGR
ncbi:MAG: hypothetical protein EOP49_47360 [Sphingobacteriales bacterium]|nr:MAG: hypothetical protein EOP49_47360 [Sphingobacteriales bacterium]